MRTLPALLLALLLLAGCAGDDGQTDRPGGEVEVPGIDSKSPDDLIFRVETAGGFVPVEFSLANLPSFSLYADGRAIVTGPQIAIFPGPALPNLLIREIRPEGIRAILEAAAEAGMTTRNQQFDQAANFVADVGTTTFTVSTDAGTYSTSVYGIGFLHQLSGLSDAERETVTAIVDLNEMITDLEGKLPRDSLGLEEGYAPSQMRLHVTQKPAAVPGEIDELPQAPVAWPLEQPLSEFGNPSQPEGYRCGVIQGEELAKVLPLAQQANQLTPWTSGDQSYSVVFRPLLPDESGC